MKPRQTTAKQRIEASIRKAQECGDDIVGRIMDECGVCRCVDHYLKISKALRDYRRRVIRTTRARDAVAQRR